MLAIVKNEFIRENYLEKISTVDRLIGIIGARGVGKTTLLLQYLKRYGKFGKYLYISADDISLKENSLYNLAEQLVEQDGTIFIVDEIHLYNGWAREIKNIYDSFPMLMIRFSGSSMLNIIYEKYDLSRRAVICTINELSFREYHKLSFNKSLPILKFPDIISNPIEISNDLIASDSSIYQSFLKYLKGGTYPFFMENQESYRDKLFNALEKIIRVDIPSSINIKFDHLNIFSRLIYRIIESRVPYKVNVTTLAKEFGITIPTLYTYLDILEKTKIFRPIKRASKKVTKKPDKILFHNSNILTAYSEEYGFDVNIGTVRETFFVSNFDRVYYSDKGDFIVNDYTFEVGGKDKSFKQIKDIPNSALVIDTNATFNSNKIPLWMFGLLK